MIENTTPQPYPLFLAEEGGTEVLFVLGWEAVRVGARTRLLPIAVPYGVMGARPAVVEGSYAVYATLAEAEALT